MAHDPFIAAVLGVPANRLGPFLSAQETAVDALTRAVALVEELQALVADTRDELDLARPTCVAEWHIDEAAVAAADAAELLADLRALLDTFDVVVQRHARKAAAA